jgi:MFS family permease
LRNETYVISVLQQLHKQLREADLTNFRELKRGWRFVLGAFIGIGGGFASLYFYTAGLFIKPLAAEFGWSRSEASLGALSFTIGNVIGLPIVGRLVDRYGEIPVAFISGQLLALSFLMLGLFTQGLASFLFLVLLLTLISAGSNAIGYNRIIVRHFVEQRGLALGLALTGMAFGAAFLPSWLAPFIADQGWRPAYFTLAGLAAVMACVAALLLREKTPSQAAPSTPQALLSWREICSHPAFLPIAVMIFLSSTAVLGTTLHMIPLLSDGGMSPTQAGAAAATLGVAVLVGLVFSGWPSFCSPSRVWGRCCCGPAFPNWQSPGQLSSASAWAPRVTCSPICSADASRSATSAASMARSSRCTRSAPVWAACSRADCTTRRAAIRPGCCWQPARFSPPEPWHW